MVKINKTETVFSPLIPSILNPKILSSVKNINSKPISSFFGHCRTVENKEQIHLIINYQNNDREQ
ncbi:MAG TPA: hypothetical protein DIW27_03915, partial [Cytophagales bacterium]|nr:hypothetical protein [Cytophagales bacterium]